jgi:hypothetical protein
VGPTGAALEDDNRGAAAEEEPGRTGAELALAKEDAPSEEDWTGENADEDTDEGTEEEATLEPAGREEDGVWLAEDVGGVPAEEPVLSAASDEAIPHGVPEDPPPSGTHTPAAQESPAGQSSPSSQEVRHWPPTHR